MARPEDTLSRACLAAYGAASGVLLLRNVVARVHPYGKPEISMMVGLGAGSPDIVGSVDGVPFAVELKVPGRKADPHQAAVHAAWRAMGWYVGVAHTVEEFGAHVEAARARRAA